MRNRMGLVIAAALFAATLWSGSASAQSTSGNAAFTLAPGGKATIDFESFCIDYGKKFPEQIGLPPTNVADPAVTGAINNALSKGYTSSNPKEVQFAIWKARGATGAPQPGAVGTEIAQNVTPPTPPQGATSLLDAIKNNRVRATAGSWQGIGEKLTINNFQDNFQGKGQLQIENTSGQRLTLYMPVGTVFPAPSAEFQSMAGYATNVSVTNPQQTMPNTGIADNLTITQMLLLSLMVLDLGVLGLLLLRRFTAMRWL